jgi:hypothetical protein
VIAGFCSFRALDHQHRVLHQSSLPYLSEDRDSTSYHRSSPQDFGPSRDRCSCCLSSSFPCGASLPPRPHVRGNSSVAQHVPIPTDTQLYCAHQPILLVGKDLLFPSFSQKFCLRHRVYYQAKIIAMMTADGTKPNTAALHGDSF